MQGPWRALQEVDRMTNAHSAKVATGHAKCSSESDRSVDHNPEDLKSIFKQVPNMNAKRFLKLENFKSLAHAKRFAFGEPKFLSG